MNNQNPYIQIYLNLNKRIITKFHNITDEGIEASYISPENVIYLNINKFIKNISQNKFEFFEDLVCKNKKNIEEIFKKIKSTIENFEQIEIRIKVESFFIRVLFNSEKNKPNYIKFEPLKPYKQKKYFDNKTDIDTEFYIKFALQLTNDFAIHSFELKNF